MAFEAKRLRVQLPCGEATVQEQAAAAQQGPVGTQQTLTQTLCAIPSVGCAASCHFPTHPCQDFGSLCEFPTNQCRFPTNLCAGNFQTLCQGFASPCQGFGSPCPFNTCGFNSPCGGHLSVVCRFGSRPDLTETICGGSEPIENPGTIVVAPEHLPVLREQLEAQLKEVEIAEQAIKDLGQEG
jgi:hypothetical protein